MFHKPLAAMETVCPICRGPHTLACQYDDGDPRPYEFCRETGEYLPTLDPGPARPADLLGTRAESIRNGRCTSCAEPVAPFRDRGSAREHRISGLCQGCQDATFGGAPCPT